MQVEVPVPKEDIEKLVVKAVEWYLEEIKRNEGKAETTKLEIELPKELADFLIKFCKWAGYDVNGYVKTALIYDMEATLGNVAGEGIITADELLESIQELKRKYL